MIHESFLQMGRFGRADQDRFHVVVGLAGLGSRAVALNTELQGENVFCEHEAIHENNSFRRAAQKTKGHYKEEPLSDYEKKRGY